MSNVLLVGRPGSGKCKLLESIVDEFKHVIWVTTLTSAEFVRSKIRNENLWVVDTFTWFRRKTHTNMDVIVSNPLNLNEISLAIGKVLDELQGNYLLVLNSISGLLLYHPYTRIVQFLRSLLVRIESEGGSGAFTLVKDAHEKNIEILITMLFPNILELQDGGVRFVKSILPLERNTFDVENEEVRKILVELLRFKPF